MTASVIGTGIGYLLRKPLLFILIRPLNQPIFYLSPVGGFNFVLKLSLFFGFLISLPVWIYHLIRFIEPALPKKLPSFLSIILLTSSLLLIAGISFAYFVSLPAALYFLNSFASDEVQSLISTEEYFTFITRYLIGFGLIFQLPLVMWAINAVHPISLSTLLRQERWVVLVSFIVAAIITPTPDLFNQLIMALPLILLYQATVVMIWFINQKKT